MKAIIPTGGRGTRMQPLTFSTNKHFIPIANKPLIYYPIETIVQAGIKNIAITYNPGWLEMVKSFLGDGSKWGVKFTYIIQKEPLGLANIFQVCEEYLGGEPFLMHLGDNIFVNGIKKQVEYFNKKKPNALAVIARHPENTRMGVPYFDKKGKLIRYVEKPKTPPNDLAVIGVYLFDNTVFKCFRGKDKIKPSKRGEFEIGFPYQWLIDHGYRVDTMEYRGKWLDPGKFDDWLEANQYLLDTKTQGKLKSKVDGTNHIGNRVDMGKRCKVRNSEIRGPVSIGDDVTIIDSYIGPFTSVSDNCIIEGSHVENSVLMNGVIIRNIKQPVNESLIGTDAEVLKGDGPTHWLKLFIGEKSKIKL
jgi:glucose-1-phosphate thymidylyltransferase